MQGGFFKKQKQYNRMTEQEFFPPTQEELEEIIKELKKKLEDERYSDEWKELADVLKQKEEQLRQTIIKDNVI